VSVRYRSFFDRHRVFHRIISHVIENRYFFLIYKRKNLCQ
jgi:hypothetical protein